MKKYWTEKEFEQASVDTLFDIECIFCEKTFSRTKRIIRMQSAKNYEGKLSFCSRECYGKNKTKNLRKSVVCMQCGIECSKKSSNLKEGRNIFCSRSCAVTYQNTHKTHGTRRSKLETWLEEKLVNIFPTLEIHFNRKDAINSELDIYFPSLKLAIELNGIFHYEPIYGPEKLAQIENNDTRKYQACLEKDIELCIIDSSGQKYFKESTSQKYLDIIINMLAAKGITIQNHVEVC